MGREGAGRCTFVAELRRAAKLSAPLGRRSEAFCPRIVGGAPWPGGRRHWNMDLSTLQALEREVLAAARVTGVPIIPFTFYGVATASFGAGPPAG